MVIVSGEGNVRIQNAPTNVLLKHTILRIKCTTEQIKTHHSPPYRNTPLNSNAPTKLKHTIIRYKIH